MNYINNTFNVLFVKKLYDEMQKKSLNYLICYEKSDKKRLGVVVI